MIGNIVKQTEQFIAGFFPTGFRAMRRADGDKRARKSKKKISKEQKATGIYDRNLPSASKPEILEWTGQLSNGRSR